ncbi:ribosomal protein S18-alanine N-acetyltransferase [Aquabacterium sp.]|uniref:ribosomal protein S18-alanine N-acetyltransferase n=1 Tax=Aquabacterium sp. TaxID=1872578 RepID=UPI003783089B
MNALLQPGLPWQRPMTVQDLDEVLAIEVGSYSFPWSRGNFIDSLAAGYLAEVRLDAQGQCLGYCVAMAGFEEMHLLNITVAPGHLRQGHARAMLARLAEQARQRGDRKLWLEVRQGNLAARQLYEAFGFTHVSVRKAYYPGPQGRREDAVVMSLALDAQGAPPHALD